MAVHHILISLLTCQKADAIRRQQDLQSKMKELNFENVEITKQANAAKKVLSKTEKELKNTVKQLLQAMEDLAQESAVSNELRNQLERQGNASASTATNEVLFLTRFTR